MTKKNKSIINVNPNNQASMDLQTMFNLSVQADQQQFAGSQVLADSQKESQKWLDEYKAQVFEEEKKKQEELKKQELENLSKPTEIKKEEKPLPI